MDDSQPDSLSAAYNVLGIEPGADEQAIKRAYRRLAKKHHPDVNKNDPKAEKCFKKIQWAYDMLKEGRETDSNDNQWRYNMNGGFAMNEDVHPFLYFYEALKRTGLVKNKS